MGCKSRGEGVNPTKGEGKYHEKKEKIFLACDLMIFYNVLFLFYFDFYFRATIGVKEVLKSSKIWTSIFL